MDDLLAQVMRPGTLVLGLVVAIAVQLIRRTVETLQPQLRKNPSGSLNNVATYTTRGAVLWNEVILYALPVLVACLLSPIKSEFLFDGAFKFSDKVLFCVLIGWFSDVLYTAVENAIGAHLQQSAGPTEPPKAA